MQLGDRHAGLRARGARLGGRGRDRHGDEIIDELEHVAVTGRPDVDHVLAVGREDGLQPCEGRLIGTDHRVEAPFLGFLRRARQRRVDVERSLGREIAANLRRRRGLGGRGVDHDETFTRGAENAVFAVDDLLDLRRPRHAQDHDIRRAGELGVGLRFARSGREDVLRRLPVAVHAHRQRKALGHEILRHAVAHQPKADEPDARLVAAHVDSPKEG